MTLFNDYLRSETRRQFLGRGVNAVGWAALASILGEGMARGDDAKGDAASVVLDHPAKAKQVIYLHMVGGPPQMDLYDYKPKMNDFYDKDLPDSVRMGQRLTGMTSGQARFPVAPSKFKFAQYGKSGMWVSELLPQTAKMVDDMCFIRSMHTDAINHEPAITMMQTGNQVTGRPCLGAWTSYGLGSLNKNLPTFVVQVAKPSNQEQVQAISARLWSSGYLSGEHAGVSFRTAGDPILYITNPDGVSPEVRRKTLDGMKALNEMNYQAVGDPETHTRIEQYEMAYRMQASVPDLTDLSKEPENTFQLYGDEAKKPGTFANTALLARRMVERGVRFVQIYHNNWDVHGDAGHLGRRVRPDDLLAGRPDQAELRPRPSPALLHDVDGRRRIAAWDDLRRNRRLLLQHHQGRRPRPRLPRHGAAPARVQPGEVQLPLSGIGPASDWRGAGAGGQRIAGMTDPGSYGQAPRRGGG